jgi:2-dehydro-3-deoxygluconokinase
MQVTSAESNVASVSSYLGLPVKVLTAFVKDSPISTLIKNDLRSRGMDFEGKEAEQGGPWGYRHQFNIADSGFGSRGPRVHNDRAGEVGRTIRACLQPFPRTPGTSVLNWPRLRKSTVRAYLLT